MTTDQDRLAELPLPLGPDADVLDALDIAVAIEDGYSVVIPQDRITVADLGSRESIEALLTQLVEPV